MKRIMVFIAIILSMLIFPQEIVKDVENEIVFENEMVKVHFIKKGAKIVKYFLKDYQNIDRTDYYNLIPYDAKEFPIEIEGLPFNVNKAEFEYDESYHNSVGFYIRIGDVRVLKTYKFSGTDYFMDFVLSIQNLSDETLEYESIEIQWGPDINHGGISKSMEKRYAGDISYDGKKTIKPLGKKFYVPVSDFEWMGYNSLFFTVVALNNDNIQNAKIFKEAKYRNTWFSMIYKGDKLLHDENANYSVQYYIGPKSIDILKEHGNDLNKMVNLGFFGFLTNLIIFLLKFFYSLIPNYGIGIILITLLIKLIFLPLSASSIRSMKKMAQLQPEIKKLQKMYKDSPQKMNEETMRLYKTFKVNPMSGCLPLLIQLPFFWAIYSAFSVFIDLRGAHFFWWITDLSSPDTILRIAGIPLNILPLLMGVAMFLQQELTGTQHSTSQQTKFMKYLPFLFLILFWNLPSGLVLYWLINNILTIAQTVMMKKNEK